MVWPLVALGVGIGAFALRRGARIIQRADVKIPQFLSGLKVTQWQRQILDCTRNLKGFDQPMTHSEAYKILNIPPLARRDVILQAHRNLMLRNHPDNGGSNFVASKVNEAKDLLVESKRRSA